MKGRFIYLLLLLVFFIPGVVRADELVCNDENGNKYECKVPKVDNSIKVYDYAELLTDTEEKDLFNTVNSFINKYDMDIALVTINDNPYGVSDDYSRIYAQDFYYYNRFGNNISLDGFIILIDMSNRYVYMATKGRAILVFDDKRIDNITEKAYNYLRNGDYFNAYKAMLKEAGSYLEKGTAPSNEEYYIDNEGIIQKYKKPKKVNWGTSLLIGLLGSLIPAFIHTRKYRGIKLATNANSYLKEADINEKTDQFLTTFTSRTRIYHDSGSSGGHHGGFGGSSTHHGSGGSFGGGGRHF